jgi:hypothetical protein
VQIKKCSKLLPHINQLDILSYPFGMCCRFLYIYFFFGKILVDLDKFAGKLTLIFGMMWEFFSSFSLLILEKRRENLLMILNRGDLNVYSN